MSPAIRSHLILDNMGVRYRATRAEAGVQAFIWLNEAAPTVLLIDMGGASVTNVAGHVVAFLQRHEIGRRGYRWADVCWLYRDSDGNFDQIVCDALSGQAATVRLLPCEDRSLEAALAVLATRGVQLHAQDRLDIHIAINTADGAGTTASSARPRPTTLIARADRFAAAAHAQIDQRRKYTGEPYIEHPREVARFVASVTDDEEVIAAALLHDTDEDTPVTRAEIEAEFGPRVAALVEQLTDVSRPEDGNRRVRKAIDREHTARASPEAKTVKLADLISNTRSIVAHDPAFARVYLAEKAALLEVLREGAPALLAMAHKLLDESWKALATCSTR